MAKVGQYSRAVEAIESLGIDQTTPAALAAMQAKHPRADVPEISDDIITEEPKLISMDRVKKAIKHFKTGTAPGPSGHRAQHIKDATSESIFGSDDTLKKLKEFIQKMAKGEFPPSVAPYLGGANLYAAIKKDGGRRPIAVGEVLRRLVSKCLAVDVIQDIGKHLQPLQMGVSVSGGCEAVIHAIRSIAETEDIRDENWILKVDLENAYNMVNREKMFAEVREHAPYVSKWVEGIYGVANHLQYGEHEILSCEGIHQGGPLSSPLMGLAFQPVLIKIKEEVADLKVVVAIQDDLTLVGTDSALLQAMRILNREGPRRGLHWSLSKTKLWSKEYDIDRSLLVQELHISPEQDEGFNLLGAPIGSKEYCQRFLDQKVDSLQSRIEKLNQLEDPQIECCLLRSCLSLPTFGYNLRTCNPTDFFEIHERFDNLIKEAFHTAIKTPVPDIAWQQATLPTTMCGNGFRRASDHAPAEYLCSLAKTLPHIEAILDPIHYDPPIELGMTLLNSRVQVPYTFEDLYATKQKVVSHAIDQRRFDNMMDSIPVEDLRTKARLVCVKKKHSGDFLNVIPSESLGLYMRPEVYTVAVCYRLGLGIMNNNNQTCLIEGCDAYSNQYGDHEIGCKFGGQRTTRHNKIRDTIYHTGLSACLNPQRETNNLDPESASRPADVLFTDFGTMGTVAVDVSVVSPLRADLMSHVLKEPGYALEHVRKEKLRKHHHTCQMNGMTCMPLPVETFGGWEPKDQDTGRISVPSH